jgi:hypothetical protein
MGVVACSYPVDQGSVRQGVFGWGHLSQITTYFESRRGWRSSRWESLGRSLQETGWAAAMRCQRSCYPSSWRACCPPCPCRGCERAVLAVRSTHQHWSLTQFIGSTDGEVG